MTVDVFQEPRKVSAGAIALIAAGIILLAALVFFLIIYFVLMPTKSDATYIWHFGSFVTTQLAWSEDFLQLTSEKVHQKRRHYNDLLNKLMTNQIQISKISVEGFRPATSRQCPGNVAVTAVNFIVFSDSGELSYAKQLRNVFLEVAQNQSWIKAEIGDNACNTTFCSPGTCAAAYDMKHLSETCSCGNNCPLIGSSHSEFCGCPIDIGDVCVNGGSCDVSGSGYGCTCSKDYHGRLCDMDRCDNKCQNGDCLQISGSYLCSCKPGFLGSFCEKTLDYCESFPCSPGNCTTLGKSYKCQCAENCAFVENGYESCIC